MAVILITDGEQRSALAAVRTLGRAGHTMHVAAARRSSLAGASRFAARRLEVPDPLSAPEGFAGAIRRAVAAGGIDVVMPMTEAAILALIPSRGKLDVIIPAPLDERFRRICDKGEVLAEAKRVGIAVPEQWVFASPSTRPDLAALPYPVVLKPTRSVSGGAKFGVRYAADAAALERALDDLPLVAYPVLVQQRVEGPGLGIFVLLDRSGRVLARFAHRRIREKPPSGGVSVYREGIAVPEQLFSASLELLRRFDWEGVAMVEYKLDAVRGTPYLMEINGRFWGSLQLALDAGVDFPGLLVRAASGETVHPELTYRTGMRSRWFWGDVDHLIARLRHSAVRLALPPGAPGRGRVILDFLAAWGPNSRDEVFRWTDPLPFVRESLQWVVA